MPTFRYYYSVILVSVIGVGFGVGISFKLPNIRYRSIAANVPSVELYSVSHFHPTVLDGNWLSQRDVTLKLYVARELRSSQDFFSREATPYLLSHRLVTTRYFERVMEAIYKDKLRPRRAAAVLATRYTFATLWLQHTVQGCEAIPKEAINE